MFHSTMDATRSNGAIPSKVSIAAMAVAAEAAGARRLRLRGHLLMAHRDGKLTQDAKYDQFESLVTGYQRVRSVTVAVLQSPDESVCTLGISKK